MSGGAVGARAAWMRGGSAPLGPHAPQPKGTDPGRKQTPSCPQTWGVFLMQDFGVSCLPRFQCVLKSLFKRVFPLMALMSLFFKV